MRKITLMIAAILFCGAAFTSCQKEKNVEPGSGPSTDKKLVEVKVDYSLNISSSSTDALNRAYDVKVIYFDAENQIATKNFSANNLSWSATCTHSNFPCNVGFRLYATPKSDLSGVTENEKFNIDGNFVFNVVGKYSDGSTTNLKKYAEGIGYNGIKPTNGREIKSLRFAYKVDEKGQCEIIEIGE